MERILTLEDFSDVLNLAAFATTQDEPMCRVLEVGIEDFKTVFSSIIKACCTSELSIGIFEEKKLVACYLALSYDAYKAQTFETPPEKIGHILEMLNSLDSEYIDRAIYCFLICTDPATTGKGYAKKAISYSLNLACKHQTNNQYTYNCIIADATNTITQHILRNRFKYAMLNFIPYKHKKEFENIVCTYAAMRLICMLR